MCALQKNIQHGQIYYKKTEKRNFDVIVKKSLLEDPILIVKNMTKFCI